MKLFYLHSTFLGCVSSLVFFVAALADVTAGKYQLSALWLLCLAVSICVCVYCSDRYDKLTGAWRL